MKEELRKSGFYALVVALILSAINSVVSLYLDWSLSRKSQINQEVLAELEKTVKIFSFSRIGLFMLEVFLVVFVILLFYYFIRSRK